MRVIVVDNDPIIRETIRGLLVASPNIEVVAEAASGSEAVTLTLQHSPDLVIMDISMPEMNGLEATQRILGKKPGVKIVVLSINHNGALVKRMCQAGAAAYVTKGEAATDLIPALWAVQAGRTFVSPGLAPTLFFKNNAR